MEKREISKTSNAQTVQSLIGKIKSMKALQNSIDPIKHPHVEYMVGFNQMA